ncbi:MAG: maleylpyruvate isomerase family mycothiol-dependent enzyme [Acidimicrobiales bacterium]
MTAPGEGSLAFDVYLDHVGREIAEIASLLDEANVSPDTQVPACPDWGAADLAKHCGEVLAFWHRQVLTADPAATEPTFGPDDVARLDVPIDRLARDFVSDLRSAGEDRGCWNWSGAGMTTRWVARRMAQEFAVHGADAQATAGRPMTIDHDLAADGIDEFVDVFVGAVEHFTPEGILGLVSATDDRSWRLAINSNKGVRRTDEPAGLTITGDIDQLLLHLWNRDAAVTSDGDASVLDVWRELGSVE